MGLLFRPRCPPRHVESDIASYRSVTRSEELACTHTGDDAADLEVLSLALAYERVANGAAFSDFEFSATTAVANGAGWSEWVVTVVHTGPFEVDSQTVIAPTGSRVTVRGVTAADFDGGRIRAVRHYWDELALYEGVGLLPATEPRIS